MRKTRKSRALWRGMVLVGVLANVWLFAISISLTEYHNADLHHPARTDLATFHVVNSPDGKPVSSQILSLRSFRLDDELIPSLESINTKADDEAISWSQYLHQRQDQLKNEKDYLQRRYEYISAKNQREAARRKSENHKKKIQKQIEDEEFKDDPYFGMCLLLRGEDEEESIGMLSEWIAYHYHVWNLRHLIVSRLNVSEDYTTKFLDISQRWRRAKLGLRIDEWKVTREDINEAGTEEKVLRQFLIDCTDSLVKAHPLSRVFVAHVGVHEFLALSKNLERDKKKEITSNLPDKPMAWSLWESFLPNTRNRCLHLPRIRFRPMNHNQDGKFPSKLVAMQVFNISSMRTVSWDRTRDEEPSHFPNLFDSSCNLTSVLREVGGENAQQHGPLNLSVNVYKTDTANRKPDMLNSGAAGSEWISFWLEEFIQENGITKAGYLLQDYLASDYRDWRTIESAVSKLIRNASVIQHAASISEANSSGPVLPPPSWGRSLSAEEDSFSACLLLKDDNELLSEWIAYHYHVLKLRTLIVATDPSSTTSPSTILGKWRSMIDIIEWTDNDYMPDFFLEGRYDLIPDTLSNRTDGPILNRLNNVADDLAVKDAQLINAHRFRQSRFLRASILHLRAQNKTWLTHIDSDEYIVLHPSLRHQESWRHLTFSPAIGQNSLFNILKLAAVGDITAKAIKYPCISMPRLLYGSIENSSKPSVGADFDPSTFETLRWKFHADSENDTDLNGLPKTIIDLSGLPPRAAFLQTEVFSIHRPGVHLCRNHESVAFSEKWKFPLTVNHYIGSLKRYEKRTDPRRNKLTYKRKALVNAGKDDAWIDGWVDSFVKTHGIGVASDLLGDHLVGGQKEQPRSLRDSRNSIGPSTSGNRDEFSACLIVKDDNALLDEWLAYHYHMIGLRHVIVGVDRTSTTSPSEILDKWRKFGINIKEWDDKSFLPDFFFQNNTDHLLPRLANMRREKHKWMGEENIGDTELEIKIQKAVNRHRFRQSTFLSACMKSLKEQGRTWMMHIDTDEFVTINPVIRKQNKLADNTDGQITPSLLLQLLNHHAKNSPKAVNYPCISMPRLFYGSIEAGGDMDRRKLDPSILPIFDVAKFETFRWKHHAALNASKWNKQPKVIVDVSAIPWDDKIFTNARVFSIHRPSMELCRIQVQMVMEQVSKFPLTVNHYLGTFERYSSRQDQRRTKKSYDAHAAVDDVTEDGWIDGWLGGFVKANGKETAKRLLLRYLN